MFKPLQTANLQYSISWF